MAKKLSAEKACRFYYGPTVSVAVAVVLAESVTLSVQLPGPLVPSTALPTVTTNVELVLQASESPTPHPIGAVVSLHAETVAGKQAPATVYGAEPPDMVNVTVSRGAAPETVVVDGPTASGADATIAIVAVFVAPVLSLTVRVTLPGKAFAAIVAVTAEPVHDPLFTVPLYTLVGSEEIVV